LYELAVAAIMVRAGYNVTWQDGLSGSPRTEFVAKRHDVVIEVEAKSRHRPGVLGRPGQRIDADVPLADIRTLLRDALGKDPRGHPYLIFVDLNSPTTLSPERADHLLTSTNAVLSELLAERGRPGDGFNALILTNIAYHYGEPFASPPNPWYAVIPLTIPSVPLHGDALKDIVQSLHRYEEIPESEA